MSITKVEVLSTGQIGDLSAPRGSEEWAVAVWHKIISLYGSGVSSLDGMQPFIEMFEKEDGYQWIKGKGGTRYQSLEDIIAAPFPWGLNNDDRIRSLAKSCRDRIAAAAESTNADEVLERGRPEKQEEDVDKMRNLRIFPQGNKAKANGVSRRTQQKLDAIARERPDLLEQVKTGELSAHRAYKLTRNIQDPTPLDNLNKWWGKANSYEQEQFIKQWWTRLESEQKTAFLDWTNGVIEEWETDTA